ncbi:MAG: collagen-like protein [Bacteroidia bacterium]
MKKKKITIGLLILMSVTTSLFFAGCKGKDGAPGAQGPQGVQGEQGNANVNYSVFTVASTDWSYTSPSYTVTNYNGLITQDILDKGAVLVYRSIGGAWQQLPITIYPTSTYSETISYLAELYALTIKITDSDLTQPAPPSASTFKIVTVAYRSMLNNPSVDFNNFESVKKAFNLKD